MRCHFCGKEIKKGRELRITESPKDYVGMRVIVCDECYEMWEETEYKFRDYDEWDEADLMVKYEKENA